MPRPRKVETRMQDAKAVGSHRTCSDLFVGPMGVAPGQSGHVCSRKGNCSNVPGPK
jgi:hypothetical protein